MKRNMFLKVSLLSSPLLLKPFTILAKYRPFRRVTKGIHIKAGNDRFDKPISPFDGETFYTKISSKDTDGDLFAFESTRLNEGGPPLHYHFEQDEYWYILKGEFFFKVGEETFKAVAGDTIFGPRNVPHTFAKTGKGEGKILMWFQPAGKMEELFQKISNGETKGMTEEQQDKFREEHGFKRVGPPLTYSKQW